MDTRQPTQRVRRSQISTVLLDNVATKQLVSASEKRVALHFYIPSNGISTINNINPVPPNQGIQCSIANAPIVMTYETHGEIIRGPWYVISTTAGGFQSVIEVFED